MPGYVGERKGKGQWVVGVGAVGWVGGYENVCVCVCVRARARACMYVGVSVRVRARV